MKKILIINTGGTFNKLYNKITGNLDVPKHDNAVKKILKKIDPKSYEIQGVIYKDSLEFNLKDRQKLLALIQSSDLDKVIIIHGTDTMNETALYLEQNLKNKTVILTGAMKPFSIEPLESTVNLSNTFGYLQGKTKTGIFICMHGQILPHNKIKKNKKKGFFECL